MAWAVLGIARGLWERQAFQWADHSSNPFRGQAELVVEAAGVGAGQQQMWEVSSG